MFFVSKWTLSDFMREWRALLVSFFEKNLKINFFRVQKPPRTVLPSPNSLIGHAIIYEPGNSNFLNKLNFLNLGEMITDSDSVLSPTVSTQLPPKKTEDSTDLWQNDGVETNTFNVHIVIYAQVEWLFGCQRIHCCLNQLVA